MIQRIQSVYLLIIAIVSITLATIDVPYYETSPPRKQIIRVDYNSTDMVGEEEIGKNIGISYLLYAMALVALISIFMFRNRKLQMKLILGLLAFGVVLIVNMYYYSVGMNYFEDGMHDFQAAALSPIALIIFSFLAYRAVRRDENLVKSVDRIR